jgi:hypothetical protein
MAGIDIPNDLTKTALIATGHAKAIEEILQKVRAELQKYGAMRVTSRLNCSETTRAVPVWVGTVEDSDMKAQRGFDAGLARFGRSNRSKVYQETVNDSNGEIHSRDWCQELSEKAANGFGPGQAYGPQAGCMHQLFIAIRVKQKDGKYRHVGTITVGFKEEPDKSSMGSITKIMKKWAREEGEGSPYIDYLRKKNFNLGGPVFPT